MPGDRMLVAKKWTQYRVALSVRFRTNSGVWEVTEAKRI